VIRYEVMRHVQYGKIGEFLALQQQKNELLEKHGLKPYTVFCPAFGGLHHLTMEVNYDSIEEYAAEAKVAEGIEEMGAINGALIQLVVPGTAQDQLRKTQLVPGGVLDAS
jgi:hypothetical protein